MDVFAPEADVFRYQEDENPPQAAPAVPAPPKPKPIKPKKPEPLKLSEKNPAGFHPSNITKALETWQPRGSPQQLSSHLARTTGANEEARLTGLDAYLEDKPSVTRDEVLGFLSKSHHKPQILGHAQSSIKPKEKSEREPRRTWTVYHTEHGGTGGTYENEHEAEEAANELNDENRREARQDFGINNTNEGYQANVDYLKGLVEKEKELGGDVNDNTWNDLRGVIEGEYTDENQLRDEIQNWIEHHLPKLDATLPTWEAIKRVLHGGIEEKEPRYEVSSPYGARQHNRYFPDAFDSEEEAEEAIQDHINDHFESNWSYSEDEPDEDAEEEEEAAPLEAVPERYRYLPGPQTNYDENFVTMPNLSDKGPQEFHVVRTDSAGHKSVSGMFDTKEEAEQGLKERQERYGASGNTYEIAPVERPGKKYEWKDGHSWYDKIQNPIVRLRHNDRITSDGKKMFFLEEMQGPTKGEQEKMPEWLKKKIYDVGAKRALTLAAEGGYDKIGWTTGKQQADRYDRQDMVDEVRYVPPRPTVPSAAPRGWENTETPNPDYTKTPPMLYAFKNGKQTQAINLNDHKLEEAIGPDSIKALKEAQPETSPEGYTYHAIRGDQIEFGGQKLKKLYDVDIPTKMLNVRLAGQKLKDYGVKLDKSEIEVGEEGPYTAHLEENGERTGWAVYDGNNEVVATFPNTEEGRLQCKEFWHENKKKYTVKNMEEVYSLDIPEKVRQAIEKHGFNFYQRAEEDIFRYQDETPAWSHRAQQRPDAPETTPGPPKAPELPPAVESVLSATQGQKEAMDLFAPNIPKPPKAPKKPAKPEPVKLSEANDIGFHESAIKKALETWQQKGESKQLSAHLGKNQGAADEAQLVGMGFPTIKNDELGRSIVHDSEGSPVANLPDRKTADKYLQEKFPELVKPSSFLHGKKTVSRDEVLNHLASNQHQPKLVGHKQSEAGTAPKWFVTNDNGDNLDSDGYDTEGEAQEAANEANDEAFDEWKNEFEIKKTDPEYRLDGDTLQDVANELEDKETELGGEPGGERADRLDDFYDDEDDARDRVKEFLKENFPKVWEATPDDELTDLISRVVQEGEPRYIIKSPLSRSRHEHHFGEVYDTEDEAQQAIDDHAGEYFKYPYSAYESDEGGDALEQVPEEFRQLKGPSDNYDETFVTMPSAHHSSEPVFWVYDGDNRLSFRSFKTEGDAKNWIGEKAKDWGLSPGSLTVKLERSGPVEARWTDGHDWYDKIENPVVRIRHDDRETTDGKKMMFIEEMQGPTDGNQEKMPDWVRERIYDIGLKRAITMAIEGGYDRLGWTTGEQQADRYNLQKNVDSLAWRASAEGDEGMLFGYKKGEQVVSQAIKASELGAYIGDENAQAILANHTPAHVVSVASDVPGMPPSYKVTMGVPGMTGVRHYATQEEAQAYANEANSKYKYHSLAGADMKLGGQGLKDLYDRDLFRKLLDTKVGDKRVKTLGVKPGKSDLYQGEAPGAVERKGNKYVVQDGAGNAVEAFDSAPEASSYMNKNQAALRKKRVAQVNSIDITPQLKEAIQNHGVSLYARAGEPERYEADIMSIVRRMPASEAAVYALGVLSLIDMRPMLMKQYSTEEISYLRAIARQATGKLL